MSAMSKRKVELPPLDARAQPSTRTEPLLEHTESPTVAATPSAVAANTPMVQHALSIDKDADINMASLSMAAMATLGNGETSRKKNDSFAVPPLAAEGAPARPSTSNEGDRRGTDPSRHVKMMAAEVREAAGDLAAGVTEVAQDIKAGVMGVAKKLSVGMRPAPLQKVKSLDGPPGIVTSMKADTSPVFMSVFHSTGTRQVSGESLRRLVPGVQPYYQNTEEHPDDTSITSVPDSLAHAFYLPADIHDSLLPATDQLVFGTVKEGYHARVYVLWPSLMDRVPAWLRKGYDQQDDMRDVLECHWSLHIVARMLLLISEKREDFSKQKLLVYRSKQVFGPKDTFTLFGSGAVGEPHDKPYIVALKFAESSEALHDVRASTALPTPTTTSRAPPPMLLRQLTPQVVRDLDHVGSKGDERQCMDVFSHFVGHTSTSTMTTVNLTLDGDGDGKSDWNFGQMIKEGRTDQVKALLLLNLLSGFLSDRRVYEQFERLAVGRSDAELLLILQYKTQHELSARALQFLIRHAWTVGRVVPPTSLWLQKDTSAQPDSTRNDVGQTMIPSLADEIQVFLIQYLRTHRNPLSVTAAIMTAVTAEAANEDARLYMGLLASRFKSLHMAMIAQVGKFTNAQRTALMLGDIMAPKPGHPTSRTINDVSPVDVAVEQHDLDFMATSVLAQYVRRRWVGEEYARLASCDDPRSVSLLSPLLGHRFLKDLGFAGGSADFAIRKAMQLWHIYVLTSTAFFNSPRGRWACHALSELFFLVMYQLVVLWPRDVGNDANYVFLLCICGNLVDVLQHVGYKFGSPTRIKKYLADPWTALNVVTNVVLLVLMVLTIMRQNGALSRTYYQGEQIHMTLSGMSVLVWVRALGVVVPVYPSLGPLLSTVARMVEELIAFLFPMFVVMSGFATMFNAVYKEVSADYDDYIKSFMQVFSALLGNWEFTDFEQDNDGNPLPQHQVIYGTIGLAIYLVISAILLLNLLIAIITNRYKPDDLEAEMQWKRVQVVEYYELQVRHNLVCGPFNLVYWSAGLLLPKRSRQKGNVAIMRRLGLSPLDGMLLPKDTHAHLATGRGELPHLCFLLTLYPLMVVATHVIFYAYTPLALWRFASKNFKRFMRQRGNRVQDYPSTNSMKSAKPQAGTAPPSYPDAQHMGAGTLAAANASAAQMADGAKAAPDDTVQSVYRYLSDTLATTGIGKKADKLGAGTGAGARARSSGASSDLFEQTALNALLYFSLLGFLLAAGSVVYVVVAGVVILTLWSSLYIWAAKVGYSVYNMVVAPVVVIMQERRAAAAHAQADASREAAAAAVAAAGQEAVNAAKNAVRQKWGMLHARIRAGDVRNLAKASYIDAKEVDRALQESKFRALIRRWGIRLAASAGAAGMSREDVENAQAAEAEAEFDNDSDFDLDDVDGAPAEGGGGPADKKIEELQEQLSGMQESQAALLAKVSALMAALQGQLGGQAAHAGEGSGL